MNTSYRTPVWTRLNSLAPLKTLLISLLLPLIVMLAWEVYSSQSEAARTVVSSPLQVWKAFTQEVATGELLSDLAESLSRALGGWILACAIAAPIGLLIARSPLFRGLLGPPLDVIRPISPVAWIPLSILWLGIGYTNKIFIVFIVSFFVVLANSTQGAEDIDPLLIRAGQTLTRSSWQLRARVLLPASAPGVIVGAQYALATSWGGVIIAELAGATGGVGFRMLSAAHVGRPAEVIVGMIVVGLIGFLLDRCFAAALTAKPVVRYLL